MENEEFEKLLISAKLNKKEFSEKVGMNQNSVTNWNQKNKIPKWVKSWLEMFIKINIEKKENKNEIEEYIYENILNKIVDKFIEREDMKNSINRLEIILSYILNSDNENELSKKIDKNSSDKNTRFVSWSLTETEWRILLRNKQSLEEDLKKIIIKYFNTTSFIQFEETIESNDELENSIKELEKMLDELGK